MTYATETNYVIIINKYKVVLRMLDDNLTNNLIHDRLLKDQEVNLTKVLTREGLNQS